MKCAGIDARYITGKTNESKHSRHAWNQVKLDGVWYNCDLTWDRENFYRYFDEYSDEVTWRKADPPLEYCLVGSDNEEFKSRVIDNDYTQDEVSDHQYDRKKFETAKDKIIELLSQKDYKLKFPRVKKQKDKILLLKKGVTLDDYIQYRIARNEAKTEEEKEILWEQYNALKIKNREEAKMQAEEISAKRI